MSALFLQEKRKMFGKTGVMVEKQTAGQKF